MCRSIVDIQSATAEIRRGKKIDRKKKIEETTWQKYNGLSITVGGHNYPFIKISSLITIRHTTVACYYVYCCHRDDDVTVGVPMAYNCSSSTWSTVLINNSASISPPINYYNSCLLYTSDAADE